MRAEAERNEGNKRKKKGNGKNGRTGRRGFGFLLPLVLLTAVVFFFTAMSNLDQGQNEEARIQLEQAVRKTAAACYAAEGVYPPDLEYMKTWYGLQIDETKYQVYYEVFASNLMPEITVIGKDADGEQ